MSLLSNAKQNLVDNAIQLWSDRRYDIPLDEYPDHFKGMGDLIAVIDSYQSLGILISDMEKGKFEVLGYFKGEEDVMQEFMESLGK
jgi:hypothetical protein